MTDRDDDYGAMDTQPAHLSTLTGSAAMAAATQSATIEAGIKARCSLALARPRKMAQVRSRLLGECERAGFAKEAIYKIKRGKDVIQGLSVRFAESAVRALTNVHTASMVIFDDEEKRIIRVETMDLETNQTFTQEVTISKQHWRKYLRKGQSKLATRTNSEGETIFLVEMTEDDLRAKEHALISIVMRNHVLKLLPADLKAEAQNIITETQLEDARKNLDRDREEAKRAFADLGVSVADLTEYLGHGLQDLTADESVELQRIFQALKDNETSWPDIMAQKDISDSPKSRADVRRARIDRDKVKAGDTAKHQDHKASAEAISKAAASKASATKEAPATKEPAKKEAAKKQEPAKPKGPSAEEIGRQVQAVLEAHGVPQHAVAPTMITCFGDGDEQKARAESVKAGAPDQLDKWLSEHGAWWDKKAKAEESPPQDAGLSLDDDEPSAAAEPEPEAVEEGPSLPAEPSLPSQITWAHCLAAALKAPQKSGENGSTVPALDQEQRRKFLEDHVGAHVLTAAGSVDASKVQWSDYVAVRRQLATDDLLALDATVKLGDSFEIPTITD